MLNNTNANSLISFTRMVIGIISTSSTSEACNFASNRQKTISGGDNTGNLEAFFVPSSNSAWLST